MAVSTGLLAGYCWLAAATGLAVLGGGTRRPAVALGILALAVLIVALRASWLAALGTGALGWLFYDGFFIGRHAQLAWHGVADLGPLGVLLGAAAGGIALALAREPLLRWSRAPRSWARDWTGPAAPGRAAGGGMTRARAARR
jgi:hypothetical protein